MTKFSLCSIVLLLFAAPVSAQLGDFGGPPAEIPNPIIGVRMNWDWLHEQSDPPFSPYFLLLDVNGDGWMGGDKDFQMFSEVKQRLGFTLENGQPTPLPDGLKFDINRDGWVDMRDLTGESWGMIAATEALHDWLVATGRVDLGQGLPDPDINVFLNPSVAPLCLLQGDINVNGRVTMRELDTVFQNIGLGSVDRSATWRDGDFTGDGKVTNRDFELACEAFSRDSPDHPDCNQ